MIWTTLTTKLTVLEWVVTIILKFDEIVITTVSEAEHDRPSTMIRIPQIYRLLLMVEFVPDVTKFLIETRDQNQFHQCVLCITNLWPFSEIDLIIVELNSDRISFRTKFCFPIRNRSFQKSEFFGALCLSLIRTKSARKNPGTQWIMRQKHVSYQIGSVWKLTNNWQISS